MIVASGDFTQRAKAQQFAEARVLEAMPRRQVVVPGNHDIPLYRVFERLMTPYALYRQYISHDLNTVIRRDDTVIVTQHHQSARHDHRRADQALAARLFPPGVARRAGGDGQDRGCAPPFRAGPISTIGTT